MQQLSYEAGLKEVTDILQPKDDYYAAFQKIKPVLDAVHEMVASRPDGMPSGHLYAMLMGNMSLDTYENMLTIMIKAGGITRTGHLLKAVK